MPRFLLLLCLLGVALLGCEDDAAGPGEAVASVSVSPASRSLIVGDTLTFTATVQDAAGNVMTDQSVSWTSSDPGVATVSDGFVTAVDTGSAVITASAGDESGSATVAVQAEPVSSVVVTPGTSAFVVRGTTELGVVLLDAAGDTLTGRDVAWQSGDTTIARVDASGAVVGVGAGEVEITATSEGQAGTAAITVLQSDLVVKGLYTQFERRGWPSGYYSGDVIKTFHQFDDVVGRTVAEEVADQLDHIGALGVNTITFELRTADAEFDPDPPSPPACKVSPALGLLWPQPTATELDNLDAFMDLVDSKGMRVLLRLVNTRMDYHDEAETWVGSILQRVGGHPALELVLFEGDERVIDADGDGVANECGGRAEPALYLGPDTGVSEYIAWAIGYGQSLGVPARKMSAQATIGFYHIDTGAPATSGNDGHLWYAPGVMKTIFDRAAIPEADRTYALSFYQMRKCRFATAATGACEDTDPHTWGDESMLRVMRTIGHHSPARVIAVEMGVVVPVQDGWNSEQALPSLVEIMRNRGVEGGSFWRWTTFDDSEDANPDLETPVKWRGVEYDYTPVADVLKGLYTGS